MRKCVVSNQIDWLIQKEQWAGLKTIAMIEETQEIKGKKSTEHRFFISSLPADAKQIGKAVRAHWLVENGLHWTLFSMKTIPGSGKIMQVKIGRSCDILR